MQFHIKLTKYPFLLYNLLHTCKASQNIVNYLKSNWIGKIWKWKKLMFSSISANGEHILILCLLVLRTCTLSLCSLGADLYISSKSLSSFWLAWACFSWKRRSLRPSRSALPLSLCSGSSSSLVRTDAGWSSGSDLPLDVGVGGDGTWSLGGAESDPGVGPLVPIAAAFSPVPLLIGFCSFAARSAFNWKLYKNQWSNQYFWSVQIL